jgi:hypothetical protein
MQILHLLLSADFREAAALRAQADSVRRVEPNCTCGCPSVTPEVDRAAAPPARSWSKLPVELAELRRPDGVPRSVLCFLDEGGYLSNLECEYYDDATGEWPDPRNCAVLIHDDHGYVQAAVLPGAVAIQPAESSDRWVQLGFDDDGGFCATTWSGYRECFTAAGELTSRTFVK